MPTYHIMCTHHGRPALVQITARYSKDALTLASRTATNLQILFATKPKEKQPM